MADRMSAYIWIGGKLKREHLDDFRAAVLAEGAGPDWGEVFGDDFDIEPGVVLVMVADELAWGHFNIEDQLAGWGLEFRRETEAKHGYPAVVVINGESHSSDGDNAVLTAEQLKKFSSIEEAVVHLTEIDNWMPPPLEIVDA